MFIGGCAVEDYVSAAKHCPCSRALILAPPPAAFDTPQIYAYSAEYVLSLLAPQHWYFSHFSIQDYLRKDGV